ncbi:MAG: N-acetyltransferase [Planctomycetes bacterium]|nr:N-acetyltransferase [Planctomycetota bacterium]
MADYFVHPTSVVDDGASIGENTKIWHFCHITAPSSIGPDCSLGQNVFVAKNVRIGRNVKIQNNVSVYEGVILEDDVFCGPSMVFTNVINPRSFVSRKDEYKTTLVKRGASIGANATLVCGVTIGMYAFVGAGSLVTHDVADFQLVYGSPARPHGWVCWCGEKLDLVDKAGTCAGCGRKYELLGGALKPAAEVS